MYEIQHNKINTACRLTMIFPGRKFSMLPSGTLTVLSEVFCYHHKYIYATSLTVRRLSFIQIRCSVFSLVSSTSCSISKFEHTIGKLFICHVYINDLDTFYSFHQFFASIGVFSQVNTEFCYCMLFCSDRLCYSFKRFQWHFLQCFFVCFYASFISQITDTNDKWISFWYAMIKFYLVLTFFKLQNITIWIQKIIMFFFILFTLDRA